MRDIHTLDNTYLSWSRPSTCKKAALMSLFRIGSEKGWCSSTRLAKMSFHQATHFRWYLSSGISTW